MRPAVLGSVFFLVASACSQQDDAAAIRKLVQKGAALAEAHNISGLMELATKDIVGQPGGYDRSAINRILWLALKHYGQIKILYPKPSVTLLAEDNRASCGIYVLIVKKDRVIPDLQDLYDDPKGWIDTVGENADLYQLFFYAQRLQLKHNLPSPPGAYVISPLPAQDERAGRAEIEGRYRRILWRAGQECAGDVRLVNLPLTEILRSMGRSRREQEVLLAQVRQSLWAT